MARLKRRELATEARRRNQELAARLGAELRTSRMHRRLTQAALATELRIAQSTVSRMERGDGGSTALGLWQLAFATVDRRLDLAPSPDPLREVRDAAHLAMQDLVLRCARAAGYGRSFELATKPMDPSRSADVGLRDEGRRLLVLVECWNSIGDIGAAARSTSRKLAEAEQLAVALGMGPDIRVRGVWVVRATRRNIDLVRRYPEVFATRFPGSSAGWVRALVAGEAPPMEAGLIWCDIPATRLFAWRQR